MKTPVSVAALHAFQAGNTGSNPVGDTSGCRDSQRLAGQKRSTAENSGAPSSPPPHHDSSERGSSPPPSPSLPAGKTCRDCAHWTRCKALIQDLTGKETDCDWTPSRFRERPEARMRPHALLVSTRSRRLMWLAAGALLVLLVSHMGGGSSSIRSGLQTSANGVRHG